MTGLVIRRHLCYFALYPFFLLIIVEFSINRSFFQFSRNFLFQDFLSTSPGAEKQALNILRVLATVLAKNLRCQTMKKSDCSHVFKIADACCSTLSQTWKCNRCNFMQYVYHVCIYLINSVSGPSLYYQFS